MQRSIALFDLDGVILDTEGSYTAFWDDYGSRHFSEKDFGLKIKGQTLVKILGDYFPEENERKAITDAINDFERKMSYPFVPGVENYIKSLKSNGIRTAVVTSSNLLKMENVYRCHPGFREMFDIILTSEDFSESKPSPYCYLKAMRLFGAGPEDCVVFEDSLAGLQAARASGAFVTALTTTNPEEVVRNYADLVIRDFNDSGIGANGLPH
ncbi:MAG: HAD family hydrolase [Candidatus Cryptobacteroides sp.]|nr:HAD family hydrolase [Bacteroidales bacterium]MDY4571643.1 HAD family hydrolase [Candidatus Cryptobacteroides sp.]MDY5442954.1 HAD family hydrolase [Candidatus Cryptobacteroides sp.]